MRKIEPRDARDMFAYAHDPETSRYLLWEPHPTLRFTEGHIAALQDAYRRAAFFDWALVEKESGTMIGTCGFSAIHERDRRAEVGYVIAPAFHRRGFAPEALERVMAYGFNELRLRRLEARIMEDNEASRKVLERHGFHSPRVTGTFYKRGALQRILTFSLDLADYAAK